ncbi:siphovirus Gp157 family protein [Loigolactobacillus backii]|uniref:siphovirus Gp157 family protein n=1 Tax=Loigolactobacillus backii TaxID=375175 RepID=UPI0007F15976|nr:siphovirus Gp157 family protein [Loigolactobacillus backii]ANK60052.1 hypothetical protein AYR52_07105 [Loigolactobacillus backii]
MKSLYELTGAYQQLIDLADENDPEVVEDTMQSINDAIEDKAIGYAKVIKSIDADINELKEESNRLNDRASRLLNTKKRLQDNLMAAFKLTGTSKVKSPLFTVSVRNNAPSVVVNDGLKIPVDYYVEHPMTISKQKIKDAIKKGKEVPGAELTRTKSLSIR